MRCLVITKKHILTVAAAALCISLLAAGIKSAENKAISAFNPTDIISDALPSKESPSLIKEIKRKIEEKRNMEYEDILNDYSPVFPDKTPTPEKESASPSPIQTAAPTPEATPAPTAAPIEPRSISETKIKNNTSFNYSDLDIQNTQISFKKGAAVLIIHTHTTESYAGSGDNDENRSVDEEKNMISVGNVLEEELKSAGITVIHDKTVHDYPSYRGAYGRSLKTAQNDIEKNPSIAAVIDVHRDAIVKSDGTRVKLVKNVNGEECAQMMVVCGTNGSGLNHPDWQQNLKFSLELTNKVNEMADGLMRPPNLREERFNQHLTKASIILEIGTNGNTLDEAKRSAKYAGAALSEVIKENTR